MIDREQSINEIAEVVNRNSMEKAFNDTPDNRRPEKICGTCRYFNPEFPVNGKPAPVCLAIKEMKGGERNTATTWNATLFSLLKWEVRNRHKQLGNQPRKQSRGFAVYM